MDSRSFLRSLLHFYLLLLLHRIRVACEKYTFAQPDSFAEYEWGNAQDGLAKFKFNTSQADALLFYQGRDNEGGDYLVVWLENGQLRARCEVSGTVSETQTFGQHLNNLKLSTLEIAHVGNQFEFYLSNERQSNLTYDLDMRYQPTTKVYIGGLPSSFVPVYRAAREMNSLVGCLGDVMFADHSSRIIDLQAREPVRTNQLRDGCVDGCADADCNGGRCVPSWATPRGYFCDCSSASGVGEFCNTASSNYRLDVLGDQYNCYTLTHQPFTIHHGDMAVQLQSPIPHSGTILSGHSEHWTNQFSLYLKDDIVHYEIDDEIHALFAISGDQNYRISVVSIRSENRVERTIEIESVSASNQLDTVYTKVLLHSEDEAEDPVFNRVCVGGGQMEVPIYRGTMERIFFGHNALLEPRNYSNAVPSRAKKAGLIRFTNTSVPRPLTFTKHGLQSDGFSFEFRLSPSQTAGVLLIASSEAARLAVTIFSSFIDGTSEYMFSDGTSFVFCGNISVNDNQWHHFELSSMSGGGITITMDRLSPQSCTFTSTMNFFELPTLQLGPMTDGSSMGVPVPFVGCFQNFEFVNGSEVFRPNLEVPISLYDRFSGDGCYGCQGTDVVAYCKNGGVCEHTGAYQRRRCKCPMYITGATCTRRVSDTGDTSSTSSTPSRSPTSTLTIITPSPSSQPPSPPSQTTPTQTTPTGDAPTTNKNKKDGINYNALGQWVGISTAIILVLIVLIILMVFIGCFIHSHRIKGSGFYCTRENRRTVTLPHFSASLKTAHSHTLNLEQNRVTAITNGHTVHPTYSSGEKEFYI